MVKPFEDHLIILLLKPFHLFFIFLLPSFILIVTKSMLFFIWLGIISFIEDQKISLHFSLFDD